MIAAKRARLDRSAIVTAAQDLLDTQGAETFSMARVADRLGVTTMALYRHVVDRDDLERAVVELVLAELAGLTPDTADWQSGVAGWMHALRRCWIAHPWVASMLGTRAELSSSWLAAIDRLAAILFDAGLPPVEAAHEAVLISRTTVGLLWLEVSAPLPHPGLAEAAMAHLPSSAWPRWRRLAAGLESYSNDDLFNDLVAQTLTRLREVS
jgi:AcrR family transcriptional regulator